MKLCYFVRVFVKVHCSFVCLFDLFIYFIFHFTTGVYVPENTDEHWVRRMWTYNDISKYKVSINIFLLHCIHIFLLFLIN